MPGCRPFWVVLTGTHLALYMDGNQKELEMSIEISESTLISKQNKSDLMITDDETLIHLVFDDLQQRNNWFYMIQFLKESFDGKEEVAIVNKNIHNFFRYKDSIQKKMSTLGFKCKAFDIPNITGKAGEVKLFQAYFMGDEKRVVIN